MGASGASHLVHRVLWTRWRYKKKNYQRISTAQSSLIKNSFLSRSFIMPTIQSCKPDVYITSKSDFNFSIINLNPDFDTKIQSRKPLSVGQKARAHSEKQSDRPHRKGLKFPFMKWIMKFFKLKVALRHEPREENRNGMMHPTTNYYPASGHSCPSLL